MLKLVETPPGMEEEMLPTLDEIAREGARPRRAQRQSPGALGDHGLRGGEGRGAAGERQAYAAFKKLDLSDRDYVYVWVDGIHVNVRLEQDRLCLLVMIGARPDGTKELVAIEDGYRESAESWGELLRDLESRGLRAPLIAVGDGALGFWKALRDVWPETREQPSSTSQPSIGAICAPATSWNRPSPRCGYANV